MATSLTLAQTIGIGTGNWTTPFRASSLIELYGTAGKPLSLLSVRDKLQDRKNIVILQIRNASILSASPDAAALQANWLSTNPAFVPTPAALKNFIKILAAAKVSVVKISQDWRTIALSGTTLAFGAVPTEFYTVTGSSGLLSIQDTSGLKILGDVQTGQPDPPASAGGLVAAGGAMAAGGAQAAAGAGGLKLFGLPYTGPAAGGTTAGLGGAALGTSGAAGAEASASAEALGVGSATGWGLIVIGLALAGVSLYLWLNPSDSTPPPPPPPPPTSSNDGTDGGYQAGDGTEVYGATSDTDATAIASALGGLPPVDPSSIPSAAPQSPISPANICPTVPTCAAAMAMDEPLPQPGPGDPSGCPNAPFGICPTTQLPFSLSEFEGDS
jgi:hypothetical protein